MALNCLPAVNIISPNKLERKDSSPIVKSEYQSVVPPNSSNPTSLIGVNHTTTDKVVVDKVAHPLDGLAAFAHVSGGYVVKSVIGTENNSTKEIYVDVMQLPKFENEDLRVTVSDYENALKNSIGNGAHPIGEEKNKKDLLAIKNKLEGCKIPLPRIIRELNFECWEEVFLLDAIWDRWPPDQSLQETRKNLNFVMESFKGNTFNIKDSFSKEKISTIAKNGYLNEVGHVIQSWIADENVFPHLTREQQNLANDYLLWSTRNAENGNQVMPFNTYATIKFSKEEWEKIADTKNENLSKNQQNAFVQRWTLARIKPLTRCNIPSCKQRMLNFTKKISHKQELSAILAVGKIPAEQSSNNYISNNGTIDEKQLFGDMCQLLLDKNFAENPDLQTRFIQLDRLQCNEDRLRTALLSIDATNFGENNPLRRLPGLSIENVPMSAEGTVKLLKIILRATIDDNIRQRSDAGCCFAIAPLIILQNNRPTKLMQLFASGIKNGTIPFINEERNEFQVSLNQTNAIPRSNTSQALHEMLIDTIADAHYILDQKSGNVDVQKNHKISRQWENFRRAMVNFSQKLSDPMCKEFRDIIPDFKNCYNHSIVNNVKCYGAWCPHIKNSNETYYSPLTLKSFKKLRAKINLKLQNDGSLTGESCKLKKELIESLEILEKNISNPALPGGGDLVKVWQSLDEIKSVMYIPVEKEKEINRDERDIFIDRYNDMLCQVRDQKENPPLRVLSNGKGHAHTLIPFHNPEIGKALLKGTSAEDFLEGEIMTHQGDVYYFIDSNHEQNGEPILLGIACDDEENLGFVLKYGSKAQVIDPQSEKYAWLREDLITLIVD
jgi:hypothetical protein